MTRHFRNALAVILLSVTATAGENRYLGAIVVSGASLNNTTTAAPFVIPTGAKVTVNCTAAVNMLVDNLSTSTSGATKGLPVSASVNFPTSVGRSLSTISGQSTAVVAVIGTGTCDFWLRDGNE
jgi:hypothetical protein